MATKIVFVFLLAITFAYARELMVDVKFAGLGLKQMDNVPPSQSDPYLDIFTSMNPNDPPRKVGTTVFIPNNNNPVWPETWRFFHTEGVSHQTFSINVMDDDGVLPNELIGEAFLSLKDLVEAENNILFVELVPKGHGILRVTATIEGI